MTQPNAVTMAQIAARAKVSAAAVSFALRGKPGVSAAEAARIRRWAERLGYRPNPLVAVHMAQVRRRQVRSYQASLGFLCLSQTTLGSVYSRAAKARAEQLGYGMEEFVLPELRLSPRRLSAILLSRGIPGVVVGENPEELTRLELEWGSFAAAALGYTLQEPNLHRACHAHFRGMTRVLQHLWDEGCRRIGYAVRTGDLIRAERLQHAAFLEFHASMKRRPGPLYWLADDNENAFRAWAEAKRPDAIVSADDRLGGWAARLKGGVQFASICLMQGDRNCVGIEQDYAQIAATAVDLVVAQLQRNERGVPPSPNIVLIEGRWSDRRQEGVGKVAVRPQKNHAPGQPVAGL